MAHSPRPKTPRHGQKIGLPTDSATPPRLEAVNADRELMRAVARQDRQAFKALYERYAPRIGAYLMKLLKRHELVDETVNDVMLAVWQYADRFDPEQGPLLTWLFGIAHNKGLKALRSAGRFRAEVSVDPQSPAALTTPMGTRPVPSRSRRTSRSAPCWAGNWDRRDGRGAGPALARPSRRDRIDLRR